MSRALAGCFGLGLSLDLYVKLNKCYFLIFCFWILKTRVLQRERTLIPHTSFRMQCFLVLGLYLVWSDLRIGSWAGQLHQGLMDGLQASLNPLKLHGRLKYILFPPWNGSSSSYWIQKMLRMNLVADNSSRVTIVWENFCWPHTRLRCEENHGCCWDLTDRA